MADQYLDQVEVVIQDLKGRLIPDKKLMIAIAEEMHASVMDIFRNQGADVPGGWPALKPKTIKAKQRKGLSSAILQGRGMLLRSIQSSATDDTAINSTNLRYAAIHNDGGTIDIPARTRTLRHRLDAKGNLLKQETNSKLLVFAKNSHKRFSSYTFGQKAYQIKIPARPFMVLTEPHANNIIALIQKRVMSV